MKLIEKISDILDNCIRYINIALISVMTFIILLQVFFRYVLNNPLTWTEEIARFIMVWMVFLGISMVSKRKLNISLDFFINKIPIKIRKPLGVLLQIYIIYFLFILFKMGIVLVDSAYRQVAPASQISMKWIYLALPAGIAILAFQHIVLLIKDLNLLINKTTINN